MRAKPVRRQRREAARPESKTRQKILIGGAVGLGIIALGTLLFLSVREPEALEGLRRFAGLSRGHDTEVEYASTGLPPVGGVHDPTWQNCGVYDEPLEPGHVMHSLEHGAVWLAYQPELDEGDVESLQDLVWNEPFVVMSPFPGLQSPVVVTAWGIQLEVDSAGDSRIADFVERYQQGPQTPERGAACINGTGSPLNR